MIPHARNASAEGASGENLDYCSSHFVANHDKLCCYFDPFYPQIVFFLAPDTCPEGWCVYQIHVRRLQVFSRHLCPERFLAPDGAAWLWTFVRQSGAKSTPESTPLLQRMQISDTACSLEIAEIRHVVQDLAKFLSGAYIKACTYQRLSQYETRSILKLQHFPNEAYSLPRWAIADIKISLKRISFVDFSFLTQIWSCTF